MIIDTSNADAGYETLFLESFNTLDSQEPTLRLDQIVLEITGYIRDAPLPEQVSVRKDETLILMVPNCYSSIPISVTLSIDVR